MLESLFNDDVINIESSVDEVMVDSGCSALLEPDHELKHLSNVLNVFDLTVGLYEPCMILGSRI